MSIWGKIIGGTAGFALGGPLGAILGVVAGHAFVDKTKKPDMQTRKQVAFTAGVIVLAAKMAKADGVVRDEEIHAFRKVFHPILGEQVAEAEVARIFNVAKKDSSGFEPYAQQLSEMFSNNPEVLEELLSCLFLIARADNVYHSRENEYLESVARIFGLGEAAFRRIRSTHGVDKPDPYEVLGVSRNISDEKLKNEYRKLVRAHHPDTLIAQGVPQEFVESANDKLAIINDAYDRIKKERKVICADDPL
ncbi:MAG: TerB family tellurite resistance protein [Candidatus Dadabacteria bacterium]|nr:TerB family tellurite resistance protein [Candidatus Dadabacteria bacterium]